MGKYRVAILVGQADEEYQSRFIEGFLEKSFEEKFDVCIFSMYRKYQDAAEREEGESKIFSMVYDGGFDAIVILKDTIQITGKAQEIETRLHESFQGDVLVVDQKSDYFPSVFTDGYAGMRAVMEHLITVHGYRDIAFLAGKKWHIHSIERLKAYSDAMADHDLDVSDSNIVYGDFWYSSGELCIDQLLARRDKLPEAIVAANDCMAIGLCDALTKRGYRVPEDVAVASYDSSEEGRTSPIPVTSALIPAEEIGTYSAENIAARLEEREIRPFKQPPKLVIGASCGCTECKDHVRDVRRKGWNTMISDAGFYSVNSTFTENMMIQSDLLGFLSTVYSYAYQIPEADSIHICLNEGWKNLDSNPNLRFEDSGYSENMLYAIRYYSKGGGGKVSVSDSFPTKELLPELMKDTDVPRAFIFTPIHFEAEGFGYAVVSYGVLHRSYDDIFRIWVKMISQCLESLRRAALLQLIRDQREEERVWSNLGGAASGATETNLSTEEKKDLALVRRILDENLLTYYFQPIVKVEDGSIYSYEALMRSTTEQKVSPLKIIKYADVLNRLSDVESATFLNVLKIIGEHKEEVGRKKIFINSIPGVKMRKVDSSKVESMLSAFSDTVVVELTEEAELAASELESMKQRLQALGIEIAVDDYGTGYSNVSNLLRYMPNYVKIDRSLLSEIQYRPQKQHFVREIIEFCHENHILALAEGVETSEELRMVIHLGADLIQGFYTARPKAEILQQIDDRIRKEIRDYHQERLDGLTKRIYVAGRTNRILLSNLMKYGNTDIVVPAENAVYKDISIVGTPGMETNIHMRIEAGYQGKIILENAFFANMKGRPCIELGEGSEVTLAFEGENTLKNGGIQVPPSASLTTEGTGILKIRIDSPEYYGIGNSPLASHGRMVFNHDGEIRINASGRRGVCIGAGQGGEILVQRGKYSFGAKGDICVGIGAFEGPAKVVLSECDMEVEISMTRGVGVGSLEGDAAVEIRKAAFSYYGGGGECVGLGTIGGSSAVVSIREANAAVNLRSRESTCIGALHGATDFRLELASLQMENGGAKALVLGGYSEDTRILLKDADVRVKLQNELDVDSYVKEGQMRIINGRTRFLVNGRTIDRASEDGYAEA